VLAHAPNASVHVSTDPFPSASQDLANAQSVSQTDPATSIQISARVVSPVRPGGETSDRWIARRGAFPRIDWLSLRGAECLGVTVMAAQVRCEVDGILQKVYKRQELRQKGARHRTKAFGSNLGKMHHSVSGSQVLYYRCPTGYIKCLRGCPHDITSRHTMPGSNNGDQGTEGST
jgi:hypothetical protein